MTDSPTPAVDKITARIWSKLDWRDPRADLVRLGRLAADLEKRGIQATHDDLRVKGERRWVEVKQAALFAYFISVAVTRSPVRYAIHEAEDYDFLIRSRAEGKSYVQPVQLKELSHLDRKATLESELRKLEKKYVTPSNTIVAVHMNHEGDVVYSEICRPNIALAGVWLYASTSVDQSRWFLYGDLLKTPRGYDIDWPRTLT